MNGHQRNNRVVIPACGIATYRLAPCARAIRAVLASSAALLALAGPSLAYAGTCAVAAPGSIACDGTFTDTLPGSYDPTVDLTVVLGGNSATSVTPGDGASAIGISSQAAVSVDSHATIGTVGAAGVAVDSVGAATVRNDGRIASAGSDAIDITADGDITIINSGTIHAATSDDFAGADAVFARSNLGDVAIANQSGGSISIDATGSYADVNGIDASAYGLATISNDGSIAASSTLGNATGVQAGGGEGVAVANAGDISASGKSASGVVATSYTGYASVTNGGDINVSGDSVRGVTAGKTSYDGTNGLVVNTGSVVAHSIGDVGLSRGISASQVGNTGSILATTTGFAASAFGIDATALYGAITVDNGGDVTATSSGAYGTAVGIHASGNRSAVDISNFGSISAASIQGSSQGIYAVGIYADTAIENAGEIQVNGIVAEGIKASGFHGDVTLDNAGSVATAGAGWGVFLSAFDGAIGIDNSGSVAVVADGGIVFGITAVTRLGDVDLDNSGTIDVSGFRAYGSVVVTNGDVYSGGPGGTIAFDNSGSIHAVANAAAGLPVVAVYGAAATGVYLYGSDGATVLLNSGEIAAEAYSYSSFAGGAFGVFAVSNNGDLGISNFGTISAALETSSVYDGGRALGISAISTNGDITIGNTGAVAAFAQSDYASDNGQIAAVGVASTGYLGNTVISNGSDGVISAEALTLLLNTAAATGIESSTLAGTLQVSNGGLVQANAHSAATAYFSNLFETTATGIAAINLFGDSIDIRNTGHVDAAAATDFYGAANAFGVRTYAGADLAHVVIANSGSITATANANHAADGYGRATATGITLSSQNGGSGSLTNVGSITAEASGALTASATGLLASASLLRVSSSGLILSTANTAGTALATGAVATGGDVAVDFAVGSHTAAIANGDDGTAIGLLVAGDAVAASNAGAIDATFTGGTDGRSYGAILVGNGNVAFTNSGWITAGGTGPSVGVELSSDVSTTLVNSGTISGGTAILTGDSADSIDNVGTVTGAISTNGGNDTLANGVGGLWYAGGSSDFGSGADTIANAGTIVLNNSSIALGDSDVFANAFDNSGTIFSFGDSAIDMGAGNSNAFTNTGIIDFRDGMADDILTITGDFAGSGALGVDVSGLNGTADLLYVTGSVANGSVTTVNSTILDVPTTPTGSVAVVKVSGDSTAGNFVLGDVTFNPNQSFLLVTGVGMSSNIDTSNAVADVFSIDFAVTGLSDAGTLAASFAPGVQSLMNSQVGTWRQRMGVIDKAKTHGFSLWGRTFTDSGTINPEHAASTFGQGGNFTFDQRNDGGEAGVDFGINEQFSVGLLAGQARATQHLNETGIGSTKIDGDTSGVYATWFSPNGFYVDASFRHMRFDAKLNSAAGESRSHGSANTFNVETGYAFELGDGYKIEPQLQYTHTTVGSADVVDGALTGFTPDGGTSSRGRAGVSAYKSFPTDGRTILTPYVAVSAVHEFDGENGYAINDTFFGTTSTKGTSALVEGGVNVQVGKLAVFGGLNWQNGGALRSFTGGQLVVRYSW